MKIYFYDKESGIYQGTSCEADELAEMIEGATIVAPPLYGTGEIPVYDPEGKTWRLAPVRRGTEPVRSASRREAGVT